MRKPLLSVCIALVLLAAGARAERRPSPLEGQPAIRHRQELRAGRFELGPSAQISLNRYVRNQFLVGARLEYHIVDWFSLGVDAGYGIGADAAVVGELEKQYASDMGTWEQLKNRFSDIQFAGDVRAVFTPLSGKMGLFSKLFVAYDTYIFAGFGFALLKNGGGNFGESQGDDIDAATKGFRPGASFGIGFHLFFNRWLAFGAELKDMVFSDNEFGGDMTRGLDTFRFAAPDLVVSPSTLELSPEKPVEGARPYLINGDDRKFSNHFFVGLNLTFFLPPSVKISN